MIDTYRRRSISFSSRPEFRAVFYNQASMGTCMSMDDGGFSEYLPKVQT